MKKSAIIIITAVLLLVLAVTAGCAPNNEETTEKYSIYEADGMIDRERKDRVLLAELVEEDFHLYAEGEYVILVHNGQETEFSDWSRSIADETPQMYFYDFNGDGEKELLIRAFEDTDEKTGEAVYCLYALMPSVNDKGEYDYTVCYGGRSSWHTTFSEKVAMEMTQPASCDKRLQFVMANSYDTTAYDTATGLLSEGRAWYAEALSDGKGNYYKFTDWTEGLGTFIINEDDMSIKVEINIYVSYNEVDTLQKIGHINCGIELKGSTFDVAQRSVNFTTEDKYVVSNPRITAEKPWQYTVTNTGSYSPRDKAIDHFTITISPSDSKTGEQTAFASSTGDLRAVDRIVFENDKITLYAKSGFSFSDSVVKNRKYTVTATGAKKVEAAYSAAISQDSGVQTLVITLDKSYPITEMKTVSLAFGG